MRTEKEVRERVNGLMRHYESLNEYSDVRCCVRAEIKQLKWVLSEDGDEK
jgi:hypothetical protein